MSLQFAWVPKKAFSFPSSSHTLLWLCRIFPKNPFGQFDLGKVWGWMGKRQRAFCSRPFWQSPLLTQEYLGIGEEAFLVKFFESQENFSGWPQHPCPFLPFGNKLMRFPGNLQNSLPCLRWPPSWHGARAGPALMELESFVQLALLSQIPGLWCVCVYQRWSSSLVFTWENLLAHHSGDKQICDWNLGDLGH